MKIACLGWGSLIWDPRELPIQGKWFEDGPFLPIEFARQSSDMRLTLVIVPECKYFVRSLWTLFTVPTIEEASLALCKRERILEQNKDRDIHTWIKNSKNNLDNFVTNNIKKWAENLDLTAVVWTGLSAKIVINQKTENRAPTSEEAIFHLRSLSHEQRKNAEKYIRMTPLQIDTPYRRTFEAEFGWTPLSEI